MTAASLEDTAREVVRPHLQPQERVELVLRATVRADRPPRWQRWFGVGGGGGSPVVLTDRRLLVLARRARPGSSGWLDVQLARERIAARLPETAGGLAWVHLETGLGTRIVSTPTARREDLDRLAGALRGRSGPGEPARR